MNEQLAVINNQDILKGALLLYFYLNYNYLLTNKTLIVEKTSTIADKHHYGSSIFI
jgi:hypothetical protein